MLTDLFYRLRAIVGRRRMDADMESELRFHLDHEIDKYVASGMPRADAVRQATLAFGGVAQTREACREVRGIALLETIAQDIRFGVRTLRRTPVVALTAMATLALSTAALATVFTLGFTLLYRPPPVDHPEQLVIVAATRGLPRADGQVSYPDYRTFRDGTRTLSGLAAHYSTAPLFVSANGRTQEVMGSVVTANYFPVLGVQASLGRLFLDSEDQVPDRDRVAVLGDRFWRTWFDASPAAIGSTVKINGVGFTVVGVTPPGFAGLTTYPAEIFIPSMTLGVGYRWCDNALAASCTILEMVGRLAPGRTVDEAAAEMRSLMPPAWARAPVGENRGVALAQPRGATHCRTCTYDPAQRRLVTILGAVALVLLLVCCANLAGLLTAQAASRAAEFGVRLSLGAGSGRIVRQVMTESIMLALAGGVAGVVLSRALTGALAALFYAADDEGHPLFYDFSLTPAIVAGAIAASIVAGCLFGVIPAVNVVRQRNRDLKPRSGTARWSMSGWLLGGQTAVAAALLVVTGLLMASARLMMTGTNFEASHVALMRLRPRLMLYPPERAQRFHREVAQRLATTPGVESFSMVGISGVLAGIKAGVGLPGWTSDRRLQVGYNEVGTRYFETLRTPMRNGREFGDGDTLLAPRVAVVNETLARRLWPEGNAVGATIVIRNTPHQVVGVVSDIPLQNRAEAEQPFVYAPFWQNARHVDARYAIRVTGDPGAMLPALTQAINRVDPDVPIAETITLPIQMAGWTRPVRVTATFVGYSAALAVLLTAIGLYGTLAFSVSRRTKEIGIRMALGAGRAGVMASIVRDGLAATGPGVVAGVLLAVAATRLVRHLLYGSASGDWRFFAAAALAVTGVTLVASWLPARRAASIEPLVALRE